VIFFSDNGGRAREASNGIFSGAKGQVYEGGIHVPCIISWPDNIASNSVSEQTAISFDLSRSIIQLSGIDAGGLDLDGYDIIDHLVQEKEDIERTLYWRKKRGGRVHKAIRDGAYKYLIVSNEGIIEDEKLFRLVDDPSEQHNLLNKRPEKATELKKSLADWEEEVSAPRLKAFREINQY
jgi:N-acetylgalactosamine-6-sulfatase